jgi:hypothetical protein
MKNGLIVDKDGTKRWYKNDQYHREDGPADISYDENGSIIYEAYYLTEKFFGTGKKGFWNFWEAISEKQRQNLTLLKHLLRHM